MSLAAYAAGIWSPRAEWGRSALSSAPPVRDDGAGMVEAVKQRLVQGLVPHLRVAGFTYPVSRIGLPGAMKCQDTPTSSVQASIAFEVNSVRCSLTMRSGFRRRAVTADSSRATRRPEIEGATTAAGHSFVHRRPR